MVTILGGSLGFYIIYAIFAAIFKHKAGFIIAAVLSFGAGITTALTGNPFMIISSVIGMIIVSFVKPIQIRKEKNQESKTPEKNVRPYETTENTKRQKAEERADDDTLIDEYDNSMIP